MPGTGKDGVANHQRPKSDLQVSDAELLEDGDEEEETRLLGGGGGFTPEQLAAAEAHFQAQMVRPPIAIPPLTRFYFAKSVILEQLEIMLCQGSRSML